MAIFRFRIKCHFLYPMRIRINKFNELKTARIFKWWLMVTHEHYTPCVSYSRSILLWLDTESEQKRVKVTCVYFQWHTHKKSLLLPSILRPLSEQWSFVSMTSMSFHCQFYISHQNDYRWELFLKNQLFFSHVVKYNCREFLQIIVVFVICMMRRRMRLRSDVVKWFNFSFCIFDFSL